MWYCCGGEGRTTAVIEVDRLEKRYGDIHAVRGISFSVGEGEIFGFLGPNGAGKSTTIKMLVTLVRPTAGRASVNGFDVVRDPNGVRRSIGVVFQDPTLDERLTAGENLLIQGMLYGMRGARLRERMDAVLAMVDLTQREHSIIRTFSGGMRRRLEIARGLLHRPRVLFLDEPTLGLDPQTRARIWEYIQGLRDEGGVTIFMTTHYMDEAEHCDRIAIIDHGSIVALETPAHLKRTVGGDVLRLRADDERGLQGELAARYGLEGTCTSEGLIIEVENGEEFIPRLANEFGGRIRAISLQRPTLDDVFLKLIGRAIRDEVAPAESPRLMRTRARSRTGRRG